MVKGWQSDGERTGTDVLGAGGRGRIWWSLGSGSRYIGWGRGGGEPSLSWYRRCRHSTAPRGWGGVGTNERKPWGGRFSFNSRKNFREPRCLQVTVGTWPHRILAEVGRLNDGNAEDPQTQAPGLIKFKTLFLVST